MTSLMNEVPFRKVAFPSSTKNDPLLLVEYTSEEPKIAVKRSNIPQKKPSNKNENEMEASAGDKPKEPSPKRVATPTNLEVECLEENEVLDIEVLRNLYGEGQKSYREALSEIGNTRFSFIEKEIILMGYSLGGVVSIKLASEFPNIKGLILIATPSTIKSVLSTTFVCGDKTKDPDTNQKIICNTVRKKGSSLEEDATHTTGDKKYRRSKTKKNILSINPKHAFNAATLIHDVNCPVWFSTSSSQQPTSGQYTTT
uniref:Hydrolase_4 domain-containing protein n=1 Tax=Rhabditophanes sp. KR3021 TaxID=114890 RepID=A0AC35TTU8_9BILA